MLTTRISATAIVALLLTSQVVTARVWSSKDNRFQVEAEAIAFSKDLVVLKKPTGDLVAIELKDLSEKDREYVESKEAQDAARKSADEVQVWTTKDGTKLRGRVTKYGRKQVAVQRKLGRVYIDGKEFAEIDPLHQKVILRVLTKLENVQLDSQKDLEKWAEKLGGEPKTYPLEGVLLQLESGDEIGLPFFVFSEEDQQVLEPGWKLWLEQNKQAEDDDSYSQSDRESFLMRSAAMAYQQDRIAKRQVEIMKLNLLGAAAGVTEIWQVYLRPGPGRVGRPLTVMVPGRDSRAATQLAMRQYPGYIVHGVSRASN